MPFLIQPEHSRGILGWVERQPPCPPYQGGKMFLMASVVGQQVSRL